ncbi:hypothetical protein [Psychroserpens mesophilus]|uniref:hypothetical protein n=1 Tax=Psychroserpens mesophilus TaxID=325473 RepID=UPI00058D84F0|nr:hypothetical protein [Psychroserpens mesophilus]
MKKSLFILVFAALAILSCNRPESSRENLQKSISEFSKKHAELNIVASYYPKEYTEVNTDSIIANTFRVRIKNYSKMDSHILVDSETNETKTKINYHRVFESEIKIALASKPLFSTTINANDFKDLSHPEFWNNATLEHVWVNQEASSDTELHLSISIINPKNNTYKLYELVVDHRGSQHLKIIEELI